MIDPDMYYRIETEATPSQYIEWRRRNPFDEEDSDIETAIDAIGRLLDDQQEKIARLEALVAQAQSAKEPSDG